MEYNFLRKAFPNNPRMDFIQEASPSHSDEKLLAVCLPLELGKDCYGKYRSFLKDSDGLLPEECIQEKENEYQIFYKLGDFQPLEKLNKPYDLWIMRRAAKILHRLLEDKFRSGHFIGKEAIFVDEENWEVRIGFMGLNEVFRHHQINKDVNDRYDEIHLLAKCFEEHDELPEIIKKCLGDKDNCPDYREMLKEMNVERFHPPYREEQYVVLADNIDNNIIEHLNKNDCYVDYQKYNHEKKREEYNLYTERYQGPFSKKEDDEHFYIPHINEGVYIPRGELFKKKFISGFPNKKEGITHGLSEYEDKKREKIKNWKAVPKAEIKFIEENCFVSKYKYMTESESRVYFILEPEEKNILKEKIKAMKGKQKQAEATPMEVTTKYKPIEVGFFDDIKNYHMVRDKNNSIEINKKKKTILGDMQYDFCIEKEKLFFVPYDDEMYEKLAGLNAEPVQCIITRDFDGTKSNIPRAGEIKENIGLEMSQFKRQIEAVSTFQNSALPCSELSEILIEPERRRTPPLELPEINELGKKKLSERQKNAIKNVLYRGPLHLIHGPPGTGKTTVIREIVRQFLNKNSTAKILICSQTNIAVDNVLKGLPKNKGKIIKIRLADKKKRVDEALKGFLYNTVLKTWAEDVIKKAKRNKIAHQWTGFLRKYSENKDEKDRVVRAYTSTGWATLRKMYFKSINVIGSTCGHISTHKYVEDFGNRYDLLIIDEASKATPAEALIPMVMAKKIVLVGDHRQLPPFVTSEAEIWEEIEQAAEEDRDIEELKKEYTKSLFEYLIESLPDGWQTMLDEQWRMPKQIGDLVSRYFYDDELITKESENKEIILPLKRGSSLYIISTSRKEKRHDNGDKVNRKNKCNIETIKETLMCLDKKLKKKTDIAIIAGYKGQVESLRKDIRKMHFKYLKINRGNIDSVINTVDGFQGNENDIVIYDIVRSSSSPSSIGFLDEPRRLNVALSRAKKLLLIVGDSEFVRSAKPTKGLNLKADAKKPILGEIADEIHEQGFVVYNPRDIFK